MTTYALTGTPLARYANQDVLRVAQANFNSDGDTIVTLALPAGYGDVMLLELQLYIKDATDNDGWIPSQGGVDAVLLDPSGAIMDFAGAAALWSVGQVIGAGTFGYGSRLAPDQPVKWLQSELLQVRFPYTDATAADAADLTLLARVRKLRVDRVG